MAIQDFGKKIGGAKKDLWALRGLIIDDLYEMNDAEKDKFVKKDNIWKKPDYESLVSEGIPVRVVYFMKLMRDSLPTKPVFRTIDSAETIEEKREGYIEFVSSFRDLVMGLRTENDASAFYDKHISPYLVNTGYYSVSLKPEAYDCITNKTLKAANAAKRRISSFDRDIKQKQFCFTEDEKLLAPYTFLPYIKNMVEFKKDPFSNEDRIVIAMKLGGTHYFYPKGDFENPDNWKDGTVFVLQGRTIHSINYETTEAAKQAILAKEKAAKEHSESLETTSEGAKGKRKGKLVPKQLKHITRVGDDYRQGIPAAGNTYLESFQFRGGEFGNWLNENDRQASLDLGYDAFYDLSRALDIDPKDISLGGRLSIAFGARGSGSALAHYESLREVINLTKMKGAGSLAHEWGHALDDILGKELGMTGFMTEHMRSSKVPDALDKLIETMRFKTVSNEETIKKQEKAVENQKQYVKNQINSYFPSTLSEQQVLKKDKLIQNLFEHAAKNEQFFGCYVWGSETNPYIEAISDFRKELTNRVIPKEGRKDINYSYTNLCSRMESVGKEVQVYTKFYEDARTIDANYSKSNHGYWQSTVEMFARAFACYVKDTLAEKGIRSDYLCGHADGVSITRTDHSGNEETIYGYPRGEERKIINRCFDELVAELKEKKLLHHKEYVAEIRVEKPSVPEKKNSLESMIRDASDELFESREKKDPPTYRETKTGQLEFPFY